MVQHEILTFYTRWVELSQNPFHATVPLRSMRRGAGEISAGRSNEEVLDPHKSKGGKKGHISVEQDPQLP